MTQPEIVFILKLMLDSSFDYKFRTFSIGTIIKPSIVDRDDALKSEFKLRGIDGVKSDITKELVKLFSKKTKKITNYIDPEIIFTVNLIKMILYLKLQWN